MIIQELVTFKCVSWVCTTVGNNTAQNSSDNLPCWPPDRHHGSSDDVVYWRELAVMPTCLLAGSFSTTSDKRHRQILSVSISYIKLNTHCKGSRSRYRANLVTMVTSSVYVYKQAAVLACGVRDLWPRPAYCEMCKQFWANTYTDRLTMTRGFFKDYDRNFRPNGGRLSDSAWNLQHTILTPFYFIMIVWH